MFFLTENSLSFSRFRRISHHTKGTPRLTGNPIATSSSLAHTAVAAPSTDGTHPGRNGFESQPEVTSHHELQPSLKGFPIVSNDQEKIDY